MRWLLDTHLWLCSFSSKLLFTPFTSFPTHLTQEIVEQSHGPGINQKAGHTIDQKIFVLCLTQSIDGRTNHTLTYATVAYLWTNPEPRM